MLVRKHLRLCNSLNVCNVSTICIIILKKDARHVFIGRNHEMVKSSHGFECLLMKHRKYTFNSRNVYIYIYIAISEYYCTYDKSTSLIYWLGTGHQPRTTGSTLWTRGRRSSQGERCCKQCVYSSCTSRWLFTMLVLVVSTQPR